MKNKKRLWIYVTQDKYELPLIVADSASELDRRAKKCNGWASRMLYDHVHNGNVGRVRVVEMEEEDD